MNCVARRARPKLSRPATDAPGRLIDPSVVAMLRASCSNIDGQESGRRHVFVNVAFLEKSPDRDPRRINSGRIPTGSSPVFHTCAHVSTHCRTRTRPPGPVLQLCFDCYEAERQR